jgi:hypothetical protein
MIHFLPEPETCEAVPPADALARVAGLGHALAAAENAGGRPTSHVDQTAIAAAWSGAGEATHDLFESMSARAVAGAVAGLEAIASLRDAGLEANRAAIDALTASIRAELDRLGMLLSL